MAVREAPVEDYLLQRCSEHGALCLKTEHLFSGFPDRTIIACFPIVGLVETKSEIGRLSVAQRICHGILGRLGWTVHVPRTHAEVELALQKILGSRYVPR